MLPEPKVVFNPTSTETLKKIKERMALVREKASPSKNAVFTIIGTDVSDLLNGSHVPMLTAITKLDPDEVLKVIADRNKILVAASGEPPFPLCTVYAEFSETGIIPSSVYYLDEDLWTHCRHILPQMVEQNRHYRETMRNNTEIAK